MSWLSRNSGSPDRLRARALQAAQDEERQAREGMAARQKAQEKQDAKFRADTAAEVGKVLGIRTRADHWHMGEEPEFWGGGELSPERSSRFAECMIDYIIIRKYTYAPIAPLIWPSCERLTLASFGQALRKREHG